MSATRRNGESMRETVGRVAGGVLFLGYFLWDEQQEVTRRIRRNRFQIW